jgi:hypothetical protein
MNGRVARVASREKHVETGSDNKRLLLDGLAGLAG